MDPDQILSESGLDWAVEKQPLFTQNGDEYVEVPNRYALKRSSDDKLMSVVSATYKPIQNAEAINFFFDFAQSGQATIEHAGQFNNGKFVYALARLNADFKVGKDDEVGGYALLVQPHLVTFGMMILATPQRFSCFNALPLLLSKAASGSGKLFTMSHTRAFSPAVKASAARVLGLASEEIKEFAGAAKKLAASRATDAQVKRYFDNVIRFDRKHVTEVMNEAGEEVKEPRILEKLHEALEHAPGADMRTARGTWWGALNAVTYVSDHMLGSEKERSASLGSAMVGERSTMKRRALQLALKAA
jgi:phage/plasmid-like protein (TIGR03299 family)